MRDQEKLYSWSGLAREEGGTVGFSVIVPTRNRVATLPRAVESVLMQDLEDFELIIVDDASTDETREYVKNLSDQRIRYHRNVDALGASGARNVGIDLAEMPLIAFLDSDDEWRPAKLRRNWDLASTAADSSAWIGFNAIEVRGDDGSWIQPRRGPHAGEEAGEFILNGGGFIQTSAVFGPRTLIASTRFDQSLQHLEDWDLYLRASGTGARLLYQADVLTVHYADPRADRISLKVSSQSVERFLEVHAHGLSEQSRAVFELLRVAPALKAEGHGLRARRTAVSSFVTRGVNRRNLVRPFASVLFGPAPAWLAPYVRPQRLRRS
jgi:hypothetical protein